MTTWLSWFVLLCAVLALGFLFSMYRSSRPAKIGRRSADKDRTAGHVSSVAGKVLAAGDKHGGSVSADGAALSTRHHADEARGWFGWLTGITALLLLGSALLFNRCDFTKLALKLPSPDSQVTVKASLNAETADKVAKAVEQVKEAAKSAPHTDAPAKTVEKEVAVAAAEPAKEEVAAVEPESPAADAPVAKGETYYYGVADGSRVLAWAAEAAMNPDYAEADAPVATEDAAPAATEAAAAEEPAAPVAEEVPAPAPTGGQGVTAYYGAGDGSMASAWSVAAAMNPDYAAAEAAAETPAAAEAPAPVSAGGKGVTEYYGYLAEDAEPAAWAEEAEMNPDYQADEPAPAAETAEAAPADEAAPTPTGGQGVTEYYGVTQGAEAPAWAGEATMNPDYAAETPAPAPAAVAEEPPPAPTVPGVTQYNGYSDAAAAIPAWAAEATVFPVEAAPAKQAAVEACRDALNAEVKTGTLNFYTSSFEIDSVSYPTLDRIAKTAKDCSARFVIEVGGHTDSTGKAASNMTLSELRAQAVVKYLVREGVPESKLKAAGYGQDKPAGDNDTTEGRRQNRRIEFVVTGS